MTAAVTGKESDLLKVARAVVGLTSYAEVERVLAAQRAAPAALGPTAMDLLHQTLGRGVALAMLRGGGWRKEGGKRLWERTELAPLEFKACSFQLLQWLVATPLSEGAPRPLPGAGPLTLADELLLMLTLSMVANTPCEKAFASQARVRGSALCWVMQPAALARAQPLDAEGPVIQLSPRAPVTLLLEAWQPTLARSWAQMERAKGEATNPAELTSIGAAQDSVLGALLKTANASKRRELLGFLVEAGAQVVSSSLKGDDYVRNLSPTATLRERTAARKHAAALLKALLQLRAWDGEHRSVRFFEEDYEKSQQMVKAWEVLGDRGFREAERLLSELENPV